MSPPVPLTSHARLHQRHRWAGELQLISRIAVALAGAGAGEGEREVEVASCPVASKAWNLFSS